MPGPIDAEAQALAAELRMMKDPRLHAFADRLDALAKSSCRCGACLGWSDANELEAIMRLHTTGPPLRRT